MRSQLDNSRKVLGQTISQQTQARMIIHFNERFHDINAKLDGVLEHITVQRVSVLQEQARRDKGDNLVTRQDLHDSEKLIRHYLTYWLLQWDQHFYYHNGMLPAWIYEAWLRQRYENYNMVDALYHLLPPEMTGTTEHQLLLRSASTEQTLYRDGWEMAKKFYAPLKRGFQKFATQLDIVMQSKEPELREKSIHELLRTGFMTSLDKDW